MLFRAALLSTAIVVALALTAQAADPIACTAAGITPPKGLPQNTVSDDDYPILSRSLGETGKTTLDMVIDAKGNISNVKVAVSSGTARLDDAAVELVKSRWRYSPAAARGKPVPCHAQVAIEWKLNGDGTNTFNGVDTAILAQLREGAIAGTRKDYETATLIFSNVIASPGFQTLDTATRHGTYSLLAANAILTGHSFDVSLTAAKQACTFAEALPIDWWIRLMIDMRLPIYFNYRPRYMLVGLGQPDYPDAVLSLTNLARSAPDQVANIGDEAIFEIARAARTDTFDKSLQINMLQALFDIHWKPTALYRNANALWFDLAKSLLAAGQTDKAIAPAEAVIDAGDVATMRSDKRYDVVIAANPSHYDVAKIIDQDVEQRRAAAASAPDRLEAVDYLVRGLMQQQRYEEGLAIADDALAKLAKQKDAFADAGYYEIWIRDSRASVLRALGRLPEALDEYRRAAKRGENGDYNVSQRINMAGVYAAAGQPRDAISAIKYIDRDDVSAYGEMQVQSIRACAYAQLQDKRRFDEALAYLREHEADARSALTEAQICANDLDGAAAIYIRLLSDPETRLTTLLDLQDFQVPPGAGALEIEMARRQRTVIARPDVQEAVAKIGRINSYPIPRP